MDESLSKYIKKRGQRYDVYFQLGVVFLYDQVKQDMGGKDKTFSICRFLQNKGMRILLFHILQ